MARKRELKYILDVDPSTGILNVKKFNAETKRGVEKSRKSFLSLKKVIGALGIAYATKQVINFGVASTKAFASFDKGMAEVATLSKEVQLDIGKFKKGLIDLSTETGQPLRKLTKALYDTISAGVPAGEALRFLETSSRLAIGGVSDVAQTVDVLTSVLNAYGLGADKAMTISDQLFTTVRLGKTTVSELSSSLGLVAPSAKAAGLSTNEMFAAVSQLTLSLGNTSEATVALNGLLIALARPTKELKAVFKEAGYESGIVAIKTEGLAGVLKILEADTSGALDKMIELTPSIRGAKAGMVLAADGAKGYSEKLKEVNSSAGATNTALAVMADQLDFKMGRATATISAMYEGVGEELAPELNKLFDTLLGTGIPALRDLAEGPGAAVVTMFIQMATATVKATGALTELFGITREAQLERINEQIVETEASLEGLREGGLAARNALDFDDEGILGIAVVGINAKESAEEIKKLTDELEILKAHRQRISKVVTATEKKETKTKEDAEKKRTKTAEREAKKRIRISEEEAAAKLKLEQSLDDELTQLTSTEFDYKIYKLNKWFAEQQNILGDSEKLYQVYGLKLNEIIKESIDEQTDSITDGADEQTESIKTAYTKTATVVDDLSQQMARSLQDWMADSIYNMELNLDSFADTVGNTIRRIAAEWAAHQLMLNLGFGGKTTAGGYGSSLTGAGASYLGAGGAGSSYLAGMTNAGVSAEGTALATGATSAQASSAGASASMSTIGSYALPAAVIAFIAYKGLEQNGAWGNKPRDPQALYGVPMAEAGKNPFGAIQQNFANYQGLMAEGGTKNILKAGFNLTQIDDISDTLIDIKDIPESMAAGWQAWTDSLFAAGALLGGDDIKGNLERLTEIEEQRKEIEQELWDLNLDQSLSEEDRAVAVAALNAEITALNDEEQAMVGSTEEAAAALSAAGLEASDFAIKAILAGEGNSDFAQTAVAMAIALGSQTLETRNALNVMNEMITTLGNVDARMAGLAGTTDALTLTQTILNNIPLFGEDAADVAQKASSAQEELNTIQTEQIDIQGQLQNAHNMTTEEVDALIARYKALNTRAAEIQTGLKTLSDSSLVEVKDGSEDAGGKIDLLGESFLATGDYALISKGKIDKLSESIDGLPDSKDIYITTYTETIPKAHSGLMHNAFEREMVIRRDEDVVPPERRMDYAMQVIREQSPAPRGIGGDGVTISGGANFTIIQQPGQSATEVAEEVRTVFMEWSRRGRTIIRSSGVGADVT